MDGMMTQEQLDAAAEWDRQPGDPTQAEIRAARLALQASYPPNSEAARKQVSQWRWQAPHCPMQLASLMREYA
jgi:hypothetical protein